MTRGVWFEGALVLRGRDLGQTFQLAVVERERFEKGEGEEGKTDMRHGASCGVLLQCGYRDL